MRSSCPSEWVAWAAMLAEDETGGQKLPHHLTVLVNFFDELRRRAPAGK